MDKEGSNGSSTRRERTLRSTILFPTHEILADINSPSKPSRPSRAYFHMTSEAYLLSLSETVRHAIFEDALNTFTSPCLVGPPSVEFAPYGRKPGGKPRIDARSGTIDQDPEFMAFLEGLANPTSAKEAEVPQKAEKITTTPLVQYLKDKKTNKSKESAAKAAKKQEMLQAKGKAIKEAASTSAEPKKKGKENKTTVLAKEAVKILNREAATRSGSAAASGETSATPKLNISKVPLRQRGAVIAQHIRMLQRDLGLSPAQAHRQVGRDTAEARRAEKAAAAENATPADPEPGPSTSSQSPIIPTAPKASVQAGSRRARGKGPEIETTKLNHGSASNPSTASPRTPMTLLKKPETPQTTPTTPASPSIVKPAAQATSSRKPQAVAIPTEGATQAFVKHANPSQGVTEALLKEAMENFGAVSKVETDKRKGFAYVDFVESEGLKKAMAANPISVAQGTVQVLERKPTAAPAQKKTPHQAAPHAPSNRGGGRGGRGGTIGRRGGRGGLSGRGGATTGGSTQGENAKPVPSAPTGPAGK